MSCENFVSLYSYIASMLSMNHVTINEWLSSFNNKNNSNTDRTIMDLKKELKIFYLLIKKEDCVIESVKEISEPERLFLDNFISISILDSCLILEIESVRNGVTIIDNKEHGKKYNITNSYIAI